MMYVRERMHANVCNPANFDLVELERFCNVAQATLRKGASAYALTEYLQSHREIKETMSRICGLFSEQVCATSSMLQNGLLIGRNRAERILNVLEEIGVVTPFDTYMGRFVVELQLLKLKKYVG